jgi:hypothetical protein
MLAQGAEIAMKAWLAIAGVPLSDLRKPELGHDLEKILSKAKVLGFAPNVELTAREWSLLNTVYNTSKKLQYPIADGFVLPPPRGDSRNGAGRPLVPRALRVGRRNFGSAATTCSVSRATNKAAPN